MKWINTRLCRGNRIFVNPQRQQINDNRAPELITELLNAVQHYSAFVKLGFIIIMAIIRKYCPMENTPLHSIPSVWCSWGRLGVAMRKAKGSQHLFTSAWKLYTKVLICNIINYAVNSHHKKSTLRARAYI